MTNSPPPKRWLTREQAAAYLGFTVKTLANWASEGRGPRSRFVGRALYDIGDLDAWVLSHGAEGR